MRLFEPFINNPALIALISGLLAALYFVLRSRAPARPRRISWLLIAATGWLAWAVWEWAVTLFSPEANIRVDLLLIIPVLMVVTVTAIVLLFVPTKETESR